LSGSFEEQLAVFLDSFTDYWVSGLEDPLFQDIHISALLRVGKDALPRLQAYLSAQAQLERDLVSDLKKHYEDKKKLETKYRKIVTSPTNPPWTGSNANANALTLCLSKMEAADLVLVKQWGGSPDAVTGFSNPQGCPSRTGVEGVLRVLESMGAATVIPLLEELVAQAESIQRKGLLNGYCSVFTMIKKALRKIRERE